MGNTSIEWTDKVWNPVTGCTKVSQGCKNCYAERIFNRPYPGRDFTDVRVHTERLDDPLRWRKPSRIFVNSMSDLFHESVPDEFIGEIFIVMEKARHHIFQILTKRPKRMLEWFGLSPQTSFKPARNIWLGVSVEDQKTADERIPLILQSPAAVRWVSYEPALGPVDFDQYIWPACIATKEQHDKDHDAGMWCDERSLDWIVAGGESGPKARPSHPDWFRAVRDQCQASSVPFFFKQWGEWIKAPDNLVAYDDVFVTQNAEYSMIPLQISCRMRSVGKKKAGRLLDGREWNEFPKVAQ